MQQQNTYGDITKVNTSSFLQRGSAIFYHVLLCTCIIDGTLDKMMEVTEGQKNMITFPVSVFLLFYMTCTSSSAYN